MDKIKRRIRSLLVVSRDAGATGPERETAARLARRLMAQHGLAERDVPERVVDARAPTADPWAGFGTTTTAGAGFTPLSEEILRETLASILKNYTGKTKEEMLNDKIKIFRDALNGQPPRR